MMSRFVTMCFVASMGMTTKTQASPVVKVLQLLESLSSKLIAEGEVEQKQYSEFAGNCRVNALQLQLEIKDSKEKMQRYAATVQKAQSDIEEDSSTIDQVSSDFAANEKELNEATTVRKEDLATFKEEDKGLADIIDTLIRAREVMEKQFKKDSSFLQRDTKILSGITFAMQNLLTATLMSTETAGTVTSMLQTLDEKKEGDGTTILQTLSDLQEKAEAERAKLQQAEQKARHEFNMLKQALEHDMNTQKSQLDETKKHKSGAEETLATAQQNLETSTKDNSADQNVLNDLHLDCMTRANEFEQEVKERNAEITALNTAKKIIAESTGAANEREYESFVQLKMKTEVTTHSRAVDIISHLGKKSNDFAMMQLASKIKNALRGPDPFTKVKGMIQEMLDKLIEEGGEEAKQKAFCDKEMAETKSTMKKQQSRQNLLGSKIEKAKALISKVTEDSRNAQKEISHIMEMQTEMNRMRQEEHAEFSHAKKDYEAGLEGITLALKVLRDYYAKGDDSSLLQTESAKSDANGIIGALEIAASDFSRSLADLETEEEEAVTEYEKQTQDNKVSRAVKEAEVKELGVTKAQTAHHLSDAQNDLDSVDEEFAAVEEYWQKLQPQCVAKVPSFEERQQRRQDELTGLQNALAVLRGEALGDTDLLQGSLFGQ
eukprot:CAMPEP_0204274558 /NCGR_PEP_ID=MMETSP0468-20130131/25250_1 /ASSEMBLY_ACC=CAM_ASM_000383 /TAXON_ID=2969 /ORGANISM="Oxyrrhis marina" /LENGTH=661 /DNA_ID=CAMNT_0051250779 /DNA_START=133 /DNA_END=2118 /DNA_ORIENTATION=-